MASQSPVDRSPDKTITIAALKYALSKMGMDKQTLKDKQEAAIMSILDGKDTMVILPTGYGKSLVYQVAPLSTDFIRHSTDCSCDQLSHVEQKSIAVVISPLIALMSDQVNDLRQKGISAVNVATVRSDEERKLLQEGKFSVVFATPESLLKSGTGLLHLTVYRENVCGIFVDEGHCVAKWYVHFIFFPPSLLHMLVSRKMDLKNYLSLSESEKTSSSNSKCKCPKWSLLYH